MVMDLIDMPTKELTCKPIDTYDELCKFLEDLPPWRSLCKELTPHSEFKINNREINKHPVVNLEEPETFCHFSPDVEDPERCDGKKLPKTLVCHDMANGYHADSYVDGTSEYDAYTFYNWAGIDIFCYFSHHLITIPPVSWINVGHAHGVKVIGTLITEWNEGKKFWDEILISESSYQNFASALVALTKSLKFDGWLLNIENKIAKPAVLLEFVKHFNFILHQEIPHAELIWYDSVTVTGNLSWQNGLNEKNRVFFDACDGLFTNYSWKESDVSRSAAEAAGRVTDLYIGIDVWGRNFYGGGQFNTQEAIKVAYDQGCSLAIFAPAWSHEAMVVGKADPNAVAFAAGLDKSQQFLLRDRALWGSWWPFLHTRLPCHLPFKTSFCRGQGKKRRQYGEVISPSPWYNLRHQQYQPNSAHGPHGYLLSVDTVIRGVSKSHKDTLKNLRSIIQYRGSSVRQLTESPDCSPEGEEPEAESETDEQRGEPHNVDIKTYRRSLKEWIMTFLKMKTSETKTLDDETEPAAEQTEPASITAPSELTSSTTEQGGGRLRRRIVLALVRPERACLEVYHEDSFHGGSCLLVSPPVAGELVRLLHCDFPCRDALLVCVVTKTPPCSSQHLNVRLHARAAAGDTAVVLAGRSGPQAARAGRARLVEPLDHAGARFREIQRHLLLNEYGFYVPVENSFGWTVRYYEVCLPGSRVTSVNLYTELEREPVLLGYFAICSLPGSAVAKATSYTMTTAPDVTTLDVTTAPDGTTARDMTTALDVASSPDVTTAPDVSAPPAVTEIGVSRD